MTGTTPGRPAAASLRATLTVAAVARRLGVAPATLRTWDRRYGLGPSEHEAGSHRRYSAADVNRLLVMRRLTLEGVAPAEAARIALDASLDAENPPVTLLPPRTAGPTPDDRRERVPGDRHSPPAGATRAFVLREASGADRAVRGLSRAATALDPDECRRLVRRHLDREGVPTAWDLLVSPVLAAVGERAGTGGEAVAAERLLTEAVADVMRDVVRGFRSPGTVRPVVLAAAEDEDRGLPLHVLAAALAECGIPVRSFGVRVPREALAAAVRRIGPSAVVVHADAPVPDAAQVGDLPRLRPSPLVLLTGPGWDPPAIPGGVEHETDLVTALRRIERAVGP
ncbi:MAG: MerR family transcriptional regulator [Kineosporiaceae bacterium]